MKRIVLIFSAMIFIIVNVGLSQDIINETGKDGKFIVRDNDQQEALVIEDGNVGIKGTLSVDSLSEGSVEDKFVVWSSSDKEFKAIRNVFSSSYGSQFSLPINASVLAADSWTESGGNIYRASGNVGIGNTVPYR